MFVKRVSELKITHTRFNCQLLSCFLSKTEGQQLTKYFGPADLDETKEFVLKCGRPNTNGLVESKEIKFLERAREKECSNFIVTIIASIENIFPIDCCIIMEKALCDLQYFLDVELPEPTVGFLKHMELFFTNVLKFLEAEKIVYCDWKFENILVFSKDFRADSIKLCDFGSIQTAKVQIKNPKNFNVLFTSPYLAVDDMITPTCEDDWISVCFMFLKLAGKQLPWEITTAGKNKQLVYSQVLFLKLSDTAAINFRQGIYWPDNNKFFELNKYI